MKKNFPGYEKKNQEQRLFFVIFGFLSFLVIWSLILGGVYSERKMQWGAERRWLGRLEREAQNLSVFFRHRCQDLQDLGESLEVQGFFANKFAGMTEDYGLEENLRQVLSILCRYKGNRYTGKLPVYQELFFIDSPGDDAKIFRSQGGLWRGFPQGEIFPVSPFCDAQITSMDNQGSSLKYLMLSGTILHGAYKVGRIVGLIHPQVLTSFLGGGSLLESERFFALSQRKKIFYISSQKKPDFWDKLLQASSRRPLFFQDKESPSPSWASAFVEKLWGGGNSSMLGVSVPVPGTSFMLHRAVPVHQVYGNFSNRFLFIMMGGLILLVWWALFYIFRNHQKRLLLQVRLKEREESEEAMKTAKMKAEEANRTKSAFIANISHEIRTPMNSIMGMTELLLDSSPEDHQKENLLILQKNSEVLMQLIDDVLDISKIEAGMLKLEQLPFRLRETVQEVCQVMTPLASKKNIDLFCHVGLNLPEFVVGDPVRLRQILLNLIGNAVKFTSRGYVKLKVALQTSFEQKEILVDFLVEDTGIGISEDAQKLIFSPFQQADGSTTRRYGGTGLGLAISSELSRKMGGTLWVQSTLGKGTTFGFSGFFGTLSAEEEAKEKRRVREIREEREEQVREVPEKEYAILLVEDNVFNQKLALQFLLRWGGEADVAYHGLEALEKVKSKDYDLVLMDVQMPEMDGLEATQKIREWEREEGRARVPIIAMTANVYVEDQEKCFQSGMDGFVPKPLKRKSFLETLEKYLRSAPRGLAPEE